MNKKLSLRFGRLLVMFLALFIPIFCHAYTVGQFVNFGDFTYQVLSASDNNYTLAVVGCKAKGAVEVPSTVSDGKDITFTVTSTYGVQNLSRADFTGLWSDVTELRLPSTMTTIGSNAFYGSKLQKLYIPKSVTSYAKGTAGLWASSPAITVEDGNPILESDDQGLLYSKGKSTLYSVPSSLNPVNGIFNIPDGVTKLVGRTFQANQNIVEIHIPASLKEITNEWPFFCVSYNHLQKFSIDSSNQYFKVIDGILVDKTTKSLVRYPDAKSDKIYTIPEGIETMYAYALGGTLLKELHTGALKKLSGSCLLDANNLKKIVINTNLTNIVPGALGRNYNLKNIEVDVDNRNYCSSDGILFNKDKSLLVFYPCCKDGTTYNIPDGVTYISERAFEGVWKLEQITIPKTVKKIEREAFRLMSNLRDLTFAQDCQLQSIPVWFLASSPHVTSISIPKSVKIIESAAFDASSLQAIYIPDGSQLTTIRERSFGNCPNLEKVVFEGSCALQTIGSYAFQALPKLSSIQLPPSVATIKSGAFEGCSALKEVTFPSNSVIKTIGSGAFADCGIEKISIPESVQTIEKEAFRNCTALTEVDLSKNTTSVSPEAFKYCSHLKKFVVDDNNPNYSASLGMLCNKDKNTLLIFPPGQAQSDVTLLPPSLTAIGDYAFYDCQNLTNVIIPMKVEKIGKRAFGLCSNLTSIAFMGLINPANINQETNEMSFDDGTNVAKDMFGNMNLYVRKDNDAKYDVEPYKSFYSKFKARETSFKLGLYEEFMPVSNTACMLVNTTAKDQSYVVPERAFDGKWDRTVSMIDNYAFEGSNVQEVIMKQPIHSIGADAFWTSTKKVTNTNGTVSVEPVSTTIKDVIFTAACPDNFQLESESFGLSDNFNCFSSGQKIYVKKSQLEKYQTAMSKYKNQISYKLPGISITHKYGTFAREFDTDLSDFYNRYGNQVRVAAFTAGTVCKGTGDYGDPTTYYVHMTSVDENGGYKSSSYIPANTGVLLKVMDSDKDKTAEDFYYTIGEHDDKTYTVSNNIMKGVTGNDKTIGASSNTYVMQGGQFHPVKSSITVPVHKAYMTIEGLPANAKVAISFGDGTTTDINTIKEDLNANDAPVYNLNGQRLQSPVKGINIINGKKVIK